MKVSNKAHRVMTIAAAILMLLEMLFSGASTLINMISNVANGVTSANYILTTVVGLLTSTIVAIPVLVALFRGKKDTLAGVLFLAAALITVVQSVFGRVANIISMAAMSAGSHEAIFVSMQIANTILLIVGVIVLAVRVLLAFECFKPGMISGNMMKWVLILLPVVAAVLATAAGGIQRAGMFNRMEMAAYIAAVLLPGVLTFIGGIPEIMLAIAFAIPVYEKQEPAMSEESPSTF